MRTPSLIAKALSLVGAVVLLAACGGATPAPSSASPSSPAAAASKPAAASAPASAAASAAASAKPSALAAASGAAASAKPVASGAPATSGSANAIPAVPAAVAVSLDPTSTAFLVLDFNAAVCQPSPICTGLLPKVADFLKKARDAKVTIVYSTTGLPPSSPSPVLSQVQPQQGEQTVSGRADKFLNSDLDNILKKANAKILLLSGGAYNGAVLYTAFHANALGYTVAVADDLSWSASQAIDQLSRFQLLNQPGFTNAENKPLAPNQVTLTQTSQVTFK